MIQKPRPTIMTDSHESKSRYRKLDEEFLHSAAIIDADGREIAITKEMIDRPTPDIEALLVGAAHPPS